MNRSLILTVVAAMVLLLAFPVLGQQADRENRGILSPEERAKLRERWTTMSEEERQQFRNQMRERLGTSRPPMGPEGQMRMAERFDEQITKMRTEHEEFIGELKAIRKLAVDEKAKKTIERLDKLIEKHEKQYQENVAQINQRRQRMERMMGERTRPPGRERPEGPVVKPAMPFSLSTFDGKQVSLSDYRGKTVVLEWLNFECPFVKYHYEKPKTMVKLAEKYKDKNVVWLAINSTSHTTPQANVDFAKKQKLPYPILDDRSGRVGRAYGAKTTPHMYVINRRGRIVYDGAIDNAPLGKVPEGKELINHVDKALEEMTTGRRVSTAKTDPYGCTVKYP
jgi:peroxiredoxin/CRISPR/Cas system-associated endoribonuclease Cas2